MKLFLRVIRRLKFNHYPISMLQGQPALRGLLLICAFSGPFVCFLRAKGGSSPRQAGMYLISLISRAWIFSPCTLRPVTARRYTIRPPHSTHSNGSRRRNVVLPIFSTTSS
ncbi:hypothetical protein SY86_11540 [Erwinia tracheiphila]|uniref:Uncharacterized protein n=1 Tax=Erwinia tracheiphila TaxID=65700 RepID=A0A0M2K945_9GAMM|nr:hypothetical protein SY86_11540 [Erwinia tracheiphila]